MVTHEKHRLMIITHDLTIGGLQQVIVNLCKNINREIFDLSVLCLRGLGEFTEEIQKLGIKVSCLPQKRNRTDYFSCLKVAKILRQKNTEIIHTHNTQPFVDGTIGALLSQVKTIVHTDHARDFSEDTRRNLFLEWLMSHFAYKVVGVSKHASQNLIKHERISRKKIITIMNGIDGKKYDININRKEKRRSMGISGNGPVIGLGVRLNEQKGITYLLQAMTKIRNTFPDIILVIAGEGPLQDSLKREALVLGIAENLLFLGPRLDMPEILKALDLYVLPSLWEGLPMVILEAMAAGCPIVSTNVGGIPMVIRHGENGSLVKPKQPQELSYEIIKLLQNQDLRKQYSQNGKSIFHKKFSAKHMTQKYEKLYLRQI